MPPFDPDFLKAVGRIPSMVRPMADVAVETTGLRDYTPGDDLRRVDWKICARHDELVVRQHRGETDRHVDLLLDASASMTLGRPTKFEIACQATAALASACLTRSDCLSVLVFSDRILHEIGPFRGQGYTARVFRFLELLEPDTRSKDLTSVAETYARRYQRHGEVFLVSDLYDSRGIHPALDILRHRGYTPRVIEIFDPHDAEPPPLGDTHLIDIESRTAWQTTLTEKRSDEYRRHFKEHQESIERDCAIRSIRHVRLACDQTPDKRTALCAFALSAATGSGFRVPVAGNRANTEESVPKNPSHTQ